MPMQGRDPGCGSGFRGAASPIPVDVPATGVSPNHPFSTYTAHRGGLVLWCRPGKPGKGHRFQHFEIRKRDDIYYL